MEKVNMSQTPTADGPRPAETEQAGKVATSTGRPRKGPRGRIIIFGNWCKGCGLCAAFCPTGVLALDDNGRPVVVAPEKCSACHWCDTHCPDFAIVVKHIDA
jgi:2-oxoglutarate ferredoxin oxidoreductase subunit delta